MRRFFENDQGVGDDEDGQRQKPEGLGGEVQGITGRCEPASSSRADPRSIRIIWSWPATGPAISFLP